MPMKFISNWLIPDSGETESVIRRNFIQRKAVPPFPIYGSNVPPPHIVTLQEKGTQPMTGAKPDSTVPHL